MIEVVIKLKFLLCMILFLVVGSIIYAIPVYIILYLIGVPNIFTAIEYGAFWCLIFNCIRIKNFYLKLFK